MAITCQCLFHSIASTWCVHQRDRLLPASPIWSVPGPWTCVRNLFHTLCDWLPAPQPVFHSWSTLFSSWWFMIYDAVVVKVWIFFASVKSIQNNWRRWRWGPGRGQSWLSALIVHRSAYNASWPSSLHFPRLPASHSDVEMWWENRGEIGVMIL